jgi:hypothetical protein
MVTPRRYPTPASHSSISFINVLIVLTVAVLLGFFIYGTIKISHQLQVIAEGQQILILKLTENITPQTETRAETRPVAEEYVSKVEFIKLKNETKKTVRDLIKDLRMVQAKLRMKQTVLNDD